MFLLLEIGYVAGYIVGLIGGALLMIFNFFGNRSETENGRTIGFLVGCILFMLSFNHFIGGKEVALLVEIVYLLGGVYLIHQHWASFESSRIRFVFVAAGCFILCVPLKLSFDLFLIYRAGI